MEDEFGSTSQSFSKENLVKVVASKLQLGMFIVELDRPWLETPFLVQGFEIRHRSEVAKVAEYCDFVYVLRPGLSKAGIKPNVPVRPPSRKKSRSVRAQPIKKIVKRRPIVRPGPAYEAACPAPKEHPAARSAHVNGKSAIKSILHSAQIGQMLDTEMAEEVVSDCVNSIVRNVDAMVWMSKIKHEHEYTAEHSLNVCILAIAFGRHLKFDEMELNKIGLCGLLHDVGKMKVPNEILDKPESLTDEEKQLMNEHPALGHQILTEAKGVIPAALDVVLNHHERPDGDGYPRGLRADEFTEYAKIIAVVDAYDAMTSDRCYSRAKSPLEAQKILYDNRGSQFDEECALAFMQAIGPYPPGTWVELRNGMVGVVLAGRRKFRHLPTLTLVLDGKKRPTKQRPIELYLTDTGELDKSFLIKTSLKDGTHGLRLEDFRVQAEVDG